MQQYLNFGQKFVLRMSAFWLSMLLLTSGAACSTSDKEISGTGDKGVGHIDKSAEQFADFVNPLIGTSAMFTFPGNCFPAVCPPFGMTQWSAETTRKGDLPYYYSPYSYSDSSQIEGFVGSHFPSGSCMGDYGSIALMPIRGSLKPLRSRRASGFSHQSEELRPYYYAVTLEDYGVRAEMTATQSCGFFRFDFEGDEGSPYVLIDVYSRGSLVKGRQQNTDAVGYLKIDLERREVVGYNAFRFKGYFAARFDKPFARFGTYQDSLIHNGNRELTGERVGAYLGFDLEPGEKVEVEVGTSFIGIEQAKLNIKHEIGAKSFEQTRDATCEAWDNSLGKITIPGASQDRRAIFYTALYHCLLLPRSFSEHGIYRSAFDGRVHEGLSYNDFSLWDTFRAEHPLLTILEPAKTGEMIQALVDMYTQGGWMPKWPNPYYTDVMIGTHADAAIADAYLKGIDNFDTELAYRAMYKNAMQQGDSLYEARGGLELYMRYGYLPADSIQEGTSRNLEFSYGDFCLAQMADALGKNKDRDLFLNRSLNYRNSFNSRNLFMMGRNADGGWIEPFSPTANGDRYYTEGTAWQYTWFVPHDIQGLIELMGGRDKFAAKLDSFFVKGLSRNLARWNGYYNHANEPSQQAPYLFNFALVPHRTQKWVRKILSEDYLYRNAPNGLPENDDCGQMSAWYVFSALGFYPVCPGSPIYMIGSPVFPEASIRLDNGNVFTVRAHNVSEDNIYIQSATFKGTDYNRSWISHQDILNGGELEFVMGTNPDSGWATDPGSVPGSLRGRQR
jgi:predicted alpha-1,2-mannosidase